MKIKILCRQVVQAGRVYTKGQVVEMRPKDAQALIEGGFIEEVKESPKKAEA